MRKAEPQHRAARALRRAPRGVQCSDSGARLVRRKRMAQVHGARRCLTFELSGRHRRGAARRIIDNESLAAPCRWRSALERRVSQRNGGEASRRGRWHGLDWSFALRSTARCCHTLPFSPAPARRRRSEPSLRGRRHHRLTFGRCDAPPTLRSCSNSGSVRSRASASRRSCRSPRCARRSID